MNHARTRRWTAGAVATTLLGGLLTLLMVAPAQASHPAGSTLQVTPEINAVRVNQSITLKAYLSDEATDDVRIAFELEGGPASVAAVQTAGGVPVTGTNKTAASDVSPNTADAFCTILPSFSSCDLRLTSTTAGTGNIRAWVDHDETDASAGGIREADIVEKRLANTTPYVAVVAEDADCRFSEPGSGDTRFDVCTDDEEVEPGNEEPDTTDVVQVSWSDVASRIDCVDSSPATLGTDEELNPTGDDEDITCTAFDSAGNRAPGAAIDAENLNGANDPDTSGTAGGDNTTPDYDTTDFPPEDVLNPDTTFCRTDATGTCTGTIETKEPSAEPGPANVCFWLDSDNDAVFGAGDADGGGCATETSTDDADATDRLLITWSDAGPTATSVDLNPEHLLAQAGSAPNVVATVYDQFGDKFVGNTSVSAELFSGSAGDTDNGNAAPRDIPCTTTNSDSCSLPVRSAAAGNARLCGWIGDFPTLAGDVSSGTCNGEGLDDGALNRVDVTRITWGPAAAGSTTTSTTVQGGGGGSGSSGQGYSLVGEDGSLYAYGTAKNFGDMKGKPLNAPIIGVAYTPGGNGYWLVAKDGGIFTFGNADFYGSMGGEKLNSPVIGMAATPTGKGYWLFAGDGGIFTFGDAVFYGSMGDKKLNQPVINMEPIESGNGYWLVAADGGIFTFGQAEFFGSMGDQKINQPVFDMTSTDTDKGYWLVARDGGVFSFGDAETKFYGNPVNDTNPKPTRIIGMDSTPSSLGYWIADANGKVWNYGNAQALGDRFGAANPAPMIGFASVPGLKP